MVLINIKYAEKEACYMVRLSGLNNDIVTGRFATGTASTFITSKKLGLTDVQVENLKEYFGKSGVESRVINDSLKGYLVRAENIMLYDTILRSFYFYLILDNSLDTAVLGDDFISCCTFSHQPESDIVITAIDMDLYSSSYNGKADCVDIAEII